MWMHYNHKHIRFALNHCVFNSDHIHRSTALVCLRARRNRVEFVKIRGRNEYEPVRGIRPKCLNIEKLIPPAWMYPNMVDSLLMPDFVSVSCSVPNLGNFIGKIDEAFRCVPFSVRHFHDLNNRQLLSHQSYNLFLDEMVNFGKEKKLIASSNGSLVGIIKFYGHLYSVIYALHW